MEKSSSKDENSNKLSFPVKGIKYKNFLTSILSPSSSKRALRRNLAQTHLDAERPLPSRSAQQSTESIYSSIEEIGSPSLHRKSSLPSDIASRKSSSEIESLSTNPVATLRKVKTAVPKEPVYATVHKPPQKPQRRIFMNESDIVALQKSEEEYRILLQKIQELSEENIRLRKRLKELQKQEEMKEANLHAKLQLEITQLEAETRKEVGSLSERIGLLSEEKLLLNDQLEQVQGQKREVQEKYDTLLEQSRTRVDSEFHAKTIAEHKRLLEQSRQKYNSEVAKYKDEHETLLEAKKSLEASLQEIKERLASSESRVQSVEKDNKGLLEEKAQMQLQLEESRQLEEEHQKLLLSLLRVTETLAVERDILLNKTSFQEGQQKELQTSIVRYGLNIGRLQEHVTNLSKENVQELLKLHSNQAYKENDFYAEQLDILREKILNQNDTITKLECEKRQLEMQLENRWKAYVS